MSIELNSLLMRSAELESALSELIGLGASISDPRTLSSRSMCGVSFEHAESVKLLTVAGNFTSAVGLLRLQYETLVRAIWILYAASDEAVSKLQAEFTAESAAKSERLPMLSDMLTHLEGKCPDQVTKQLLEFKEYSWKPLSSFVHGGIHAIARHSRGYPEGPLLQVVKTSNGLSLMAGMLVVILSGDLTQSGRLAKFQMEFLDCLPSLKSAGS
jgi:hypothetical protein